MYEVPLEQQIQRQLLFDPTFAKHLVDWGDLPRSPDGRIASMQDASISTEHPMLRLRREEGAPIRLGIGTYADDVEVVNPIGSRRVKHKVTLHYATILNLPPEARSHLDNIYLTAVVLSKDQQAAGADVVLQGDAACRTAPEGFSFGHSYDAEIR